MPRFSGIALESIQEIGSIIAHDARSPHIAWMSLQDIAPRLEIRSELYDELLMLAIDHGRSVNGLVEEILVKDLPQDAETLMREYELDVAADGGHECTVNSADPCDNCRKLDEDAKFVAQTSPRRVPCNQGGYCNRTFHWRGQWRCGCPARRAHAL